MSRLNFLEKTIVFGSLFIIAILGWSYLSIKNNASLDSVSAFEIKEIKNALTLYLIENENVYPTYDGKASTGLEDIKELDITKLKKHIRNNEGLLDNYIFFLEGDKIISIQKGKTEQLRKYAGILVEQEPQENEMKTLLKVSYKENDGLKPNYLILDNNQKSEELGIKIMTDKPTYTITAVYADGTKKEFKTNVNLGSEFIYERNNEGIMITGYRGLKTDVIIPNEIDGFKVTSIAANAFLSRTISTEGKSVTKINSVELPDSLIEIKEFAFAGNNLKNLTLPNSLLRISHGAFKNNQLKEVIVGPNVRHIDKNAFEGNINLKLSISKENKYIQ